MKKSVTQKVMEANRKNSTHSTGAKTARGKAVVCRNALKHGILARNLIFRDDEEEVACQSFLDDLERDQQPRDMVERIALEELGMAWIQRGRSFKLQQQLHRKPNPATEIVQKAIGANSELLGVAAYAMPAFTKTWECRELSVSGRRGIETHRKNGAAEGGDDTDKEFELRAKFSTPMDTAIRYHAATGRDVRRAMDKVLRLRKLRKRN